MEAGLFSLERAAAAAPDRGDLHFELALAYAETGDLSSSWKEVELAEQLSFAVPEDFLRVLEARAPRP